jgi:hypothetical protein
MEGFGKGPGNLPISLITAAPALACRLWVTIKSINQYVRRQQKDVRLAKNYVGYNQQFNGTF